MQEDLFNDPNYAEDRWLDCWFTVIGLSTATKAELQQIWKDRDENNSRHQERAAAACKQFEERYGRPSPRREV